MKCLRALMLALAAMAGALSPAAAADGGMGGIRLLYDLDRSVPDPARAADETLAVIGRRLAALDVEVTARTQGDDRLVVVVAGPDADAALPVIGRAGILSVHAVRNAGEAQQPGDLVLPDADDPAITYAVAGAPLLTGADIAEAVVTLDQQLGVPGIELQLTNAGAAAFGRATADNVGRRLAIVLDGEVISAPTVREPILGGKAQISSSFTRDEADALASLLNAGTLPAPLVLAETRTLDPGDPTLHAFDRDGGLMFEVMSAADVVADPAALAAIAARLGVDDLRVQRFDGDERMAVVTLPTPDGGDRGRTKLTRKFARALGDAYELRAYWSVGPLLVLGPDGFTRAN